MTAASSSPLRENAGLMERGIKPTVTVAQSTRTTLSNKFSNSTVASAGMPGKSANGMEAMVMTSSAVMRGGNATVLPPEPVFTTRHTKSEAGRERGMGMGMGMRMGGLVVVGLGVCGVIVLL